MNSFALRDFRDDSVRPLLPLRRGEEPPLRRYVAVDPRSRELRDRILRVAQADVPALISGEADTGRRLIARILHAEGPRAGKPLAIIGSHAVAIDPDATGWLATAAGGVLVLDQVETLPAGFLSALAAAWRSPSAGHPRLVAVSAYRAADLAIRDLVPHDLLTALRAAEILVPALRQRPGDIVPIAERYARAQAYRFGRPPVTLEPAAAARLREHPWPGNVRELQNVVLQALAARPGPRLQAADLRLALPAEYRSPLQDLVIRLLDEATPKLHATMMETLVMTAFTRSGRNQVRTAKALGVSRNVLRAQLARLGVIKARRRAAAARS
ncbi:MAG: sigma 54-interacting transcriptional regulator [Geminicoccaceae bacterium]